MLSYNRLMALIEDGVIQNYADLSQVQGSSIDVRFGNRVMREMPGHHKISLKKRESMIMEVIDITESAYDLAPGEFILAHTEELFFMPRYLSATFHLKSTSARSALGHLLAVHIDAGFEDSVLTLEIHNVSRYHTVTLDHKVMIGQILFWEHENVPDHILYKNVGHYCGDRSVQGVKK